MVKLTYMLALMAQVFPSPIYQEIHVEKIKLCYKIGHTQSILLSIQLCILL